MTRMLIIEDEVALQKALADNFRFESYEVLTAPDGETGYAMAKEKNPDVILLDVMLPRMNGFEVSRRLRAEGVQAPILMLTARAEEDDRVAGLDFGADDYVSKPFSVRELSARVRALLRRAKPAARALPDELVFEDVRIDFRSYKAWRRQEPLELTRKEFQLLRLLASSAGEALSREELLDQIWGEDTHVTTRTVDTHVANLRAKIERNPKEPQHLVTVHGIGYRWERENLKKT
jgi:DNA-binding response OmpR family regulator